MAELDEILAGQDPSPVAEQPRGEDGRFLPVNPVEAATPAAEPTPAPTPEPVQAPEPPAPPVVEPVVDHVPQAALLDERRKRQEREREVQDLREQLQRLQKPEQPPKDVWEDPAAYISAEAERARAEAVRQAKEMMRHQFANMSEAAARQRYTDYDAKRASLEARLETDPVLRSELNRHVESGGDLGEFVYKTASRLDEVAQVGSLDTYRQKLEADLRTKIMAELAQKPVVPQSLNTTSSPASSAESWTGPPPLDQILKRK